MDKQDFSAENICDLADLRCFPQAEKFKILNFAILKVDSKIDSSVLKANIQCGEINCLLILAFVSYLQFSEKQKQ